MRLFKSMRSTEKAKQAVCYVVLLAGVFFAVLPFIWMFITSLKFAPDVETIPPTFIPYLQFEPNWGGNYLTILGLDPTVARIFTRPYYFAFLNSTFVAGTCTISSVILASMAGYAFSKHDFPGKRIIFVSIIATMMIPMQVSLVPLFNMMSFLKWANTYQSIIVYSLSSAFGTFLLKRYIDTIPDDYIDSARVDGASELRIWWSVILPQCAPALATTAIWIFFSNWNSFLWPLVIINDPGKFTVPLALSTAAFSRGTSGSEFVVYEWNMAASILAILPVMIVFLLLQKRIVRGAMMTGLKA